MDDEKVSVKFSHGLSVLKGWEPDYEPDKERSDFYDTKAREDKRKK